MSPTEKDVSKKNIINGVVYAIDEQVISTRNSGFISSIKVEEGDFVRAGEILVRIDPIGVSTKISAAKSNLQIQESNLNVVESNKLKAQADVNIKKQLFEDAKIDYQRYKKLFAQGAISKREFDKKVLDKSIKEDNLKIATHNLKVLQKQVLIAKSGINVASSGLKNVKNELKYTYLSAQFDGVVIEKSKNTNEVILPGIQILKIASLSKLRVKARVQERYISSINVGDKVSITIPSLKKEIEANVAVKSSQGDVLTHTYEVKFDVDSKELLPGMFVKVSIETNKQKILALPISALVKKSGIIGVFIIKDKKLLFKKISITYKGVDFIGVKSGITKEEKVLLYPKAGYYNGMSI